jgi:hypothetical protein
VSERVSVTYAVRCPDDPPGVTSTGDFATLQEALDSRADTERDFKHCSGPHTIVKRTITEEELPDA